MPFVQGHIEDTAVSVTIDSACAHCSRPMQIAIDSDLQYRVTEKTEPVIRVPMVDFAKLRDPSIIDAF